MELAKLVPLVMQSNKKIDKASILRLTVAYLRIYHGKQYFLDSHTITSVALLCHISLRF